MKKLFLMMGLACLFMVACNNAPKQQEQTTEPQQEEAVVEEHHCPFCTLKAEFAGWDEMDETAKAELTKKAFDLFAEMDANKPEMGPEGKPCCKPEMMKSCCDKCVEGCCKEGKCICENCPCECMKDGQCTMEAGKPCCKPELTDEQKAECEAKCAEMKAQMDAVMEQWANFETMTLDEQKDLVLARIAAMGMGRGKCEKPAEGEGCEQPAE